MGWFWLKNREHAKKSNLHFLHCIDYWLQNVFFGCPKVSVFLSSRRVSTRPADLTCSQGIPKHCHTLADEMLLQKQALLLCNEWNLSHLNVQNTNTWTSTDFLISFSVVLFLIWNAFSDTKHFFAILVVILVISIWLRLLLFCIGFFVNVVWCWLSTKLWALLAAQLPPETMNFCSCSSFNFKAFFKIASAFWHNVLTLMLSSGDAKTKQADKGFLEFDITMPAAFNTCIRDNGKTKQKNLQQTQNMH